MNRIKTVMISGGAQGIGRATAMRYAEAGWHVSIADIDKEAGFEVIREIRKRGGKAMMMSIDIANEKDTARWFDLTVQEFGGVDVLVNNAGISRNGSMLTLSLDDFDRVMHVNLRGTFICSQQAARRMAQQRSGVIVNIASTRGLMSEANTEAYSASKGGILALTHAMAVSMGPKGIRVNAISPGWIETCEWQKASSARKAQHSEHDRLQHPVGRVGQPEDIAEACFFLSEDRSSFMTGQNLVIDGGMTIKIIYD